MIMLTPGSFIPASAMRSPIVAGTHRSIGTLSSPAPSPHLSTSSTSTLQSAGLNMPFPHTQQPIAMSAATSSSFSVVAADYAVPRAILAPHLSPSQLQSQYSQYSQQLPHSHQLQQHHPLPPFHPQRQHPHSVNNPSVLHPVFFTNNFQRRQSFHHPGQPQTASTLHPAFMSTRVFPPAPPAPPLPHASSPVAHGYVYREAPPAQFRRGPNSKL